MSRPQGRYAWMRPEDQRAVDEQDLHILALRDRGLSQRAIADAVGVHVNTVQRLCAAVEGAE